MAPAESGWADPRVPDIPGLSWLGGLTVAADLLASQYGWTRAQIWDLDLGEIQRHVAAIQYRQFQTDLAHRRLEAAKLRTLCSYIASGIEFVDGAENTLLLEAQYLALGTGTENPGAPPTPPATLPADGPEPLPTASIPYEQLPDAPPSIRVGQPTPIPAGARILPFDKLGRLFGGNPQ